MQDMQPDAYTEAQVQHDKHDPMDEHVRNEQSTRAFFALLSFFMAIILLTVFLNTPLDGLSKMLVLAAMIALAMFGVILLERRRALQNLLLGSNRASREDDQDEEESEDEEEGEDEEELSQETHQAGQGPEALTPFELLVQEALDSIPTEFHEQMDNLVVLVENEPDEETLEHVGTAEGAILLGLYQGVPLTASGYNRALLPERITLYQHNIEAYCRHDPARIREQVRETLLHEVAHHFGMDHEEMPIWIR